MSKLTVDFNTKIGNMKIMHAVNNGPCVAGDVQRRGNDHTYRAARFPYARNHDAAFFSGYGGEHTVDIHAIFPDFNADVNDPESYDFAFTDLYVKQILDCGTETFYRLGSKIEHGIKKYGTVVPPDFRKWAEICQHIIAHYNEGWANGFHYGIKYWEIWNEPDLVENGASPCWQGTEEEYFSLYTVASKHLKNKFPSIKIGGPASVGDEGFMRRFLEGIAKEKAPLDFFSYHWYWTEPKDMSAKCARVRKMLDETGFKNTEAILNEWNYVRGWLDEFVYSIEQIISMKGAAFNAACMLECQNNPGIDMLMYYDARPTAFNGLFDMYTYRPLKGYYSFYHFADLYELKNQYKTVSDDPDIYAVCARDGDKAAIMISYYAEDDNKGAKLIDIEVKGFDLDDAKILITDKDQTDGVYPYAKITNGKITLRLERNSIVYIEK